MKVGSAQEEQFSTVKEQREQNIKENCLLKLVELVTFKGSYLIAIGYGVS